MQLKLRFLSVKKVPNLSWSSPKALTIKPPIKSLLILVTGLILFGFGEALLIASGVGVSPWTVLAQGITNITGWSIGFATFMTSLFVLICWVPLRQTPGVGTILNAIIIALVLDYFLPYLPTFDNLALKITRGFRRCFGDRIWWGYIFNCQFRPRSKRWINDGASGNN